MFKYQIQWNHERIFQEDTTFLLWAFLAGTIKTHIRSRRTQIQWKWNPHFNVLGNCLGTQPINLNCKFSVHPCITTRSRNNQHNAQMTQPHYMINHHTDLYYHITQTDPEAPWRWQTTAKTCRSQHIWIKQWCKFVHCAGYFYSIKLKNFKVDIHPKHIEKLSSCAVIRKTNQLMMLKEIITAYCKDHMKYKNKLCG
jgi:hypothetical protein